MPAHEREVGPAPAKLGCLEAIRGLASLAVVVGHLVLAFWPALYHRNGPLWEPVPVWIRTLARFPGRFLWDGHLAVSIFFVLSGFVLSLSFFERGSSSSLSSTAIRRYPRLMLPIAASILFAYLLMQAGAMCSQAAVSQMDATLGLTVAPSAPGHSNNWFRDYYGFEPDFATALKEGVWGALFGRASYNLVLWTMPIELIGSFVVFGFLALFGSLRNRWVLYDVLGAWLFVAGKYFYLDFLLGMALCDGWVHVRRTRRVSLPLMPALSIIALALFATPWKPLAALVIVGATVASPRVQDALRARWLGWLGRLSFGLYLIHMPVVCSLGCSTYLGLARGLGWGHVPASFVAAAASLAGALLAAWGFYHAVDRPTIALTRWLEGRLFRPATPADESPRMAVPSAGPRRSADHFAISSSICRAIL